MGYRVEYQPIRKIRNAEKRRSMAPALTGLCLLLFVFLVNSMWPRGAEVLRGLVFSGDTAVTAAALEEFAVELGAGEELSSAFVSFCRTVIENAQLDAN